MSENIIEEIPDSWNFIKIIYPDGEVGFRIGMGYSGSFTYGSSWAINSAVRRVEVLKDRLRVVGRSDSKVYVLYLGRETLKGHAYSVIKLILEDAEKTGTVRSAEFVSWESLRNTSIVFC